MKRAYIILTVIACLGSCSDFLDTESKTKKNTGNFPANESDMYSLLIAAYSNQIALRQPETSRDFFLVSEIRSDDRLGGGESQDRFTAAENEFLKTDGEMFTPTWNNYYTGIYRANYLLESIDRINWKESANRNLIEGRAYFIRAYYYFELCRMFERVPLRLNTLTENPPQATHEALYGQMASDLKKAIELLPSIKYADVPKTELGLATKWAAEALMGRMFLFYTGFYNTDEIALPEGGAVNKSQVISWLEDCINNSGHNLISEYRNLWTYAYCKYYGYVQTHKLSWIGETGDNIEAVYLRKYSILGSGGVAQSYDNNICMFLSHGKQDQVPFGRGNGMGTVNPKLWNDWPDEDIRKKGTVYYAYDPEEIAACSGYKTSTATIQETGFWSKKYTPINVYKNGQVTPNNAANMINMSVELYGRTAAWQNDNTNDIQIIRFSDVLLMAAELGSKDAQIYFDRVRSRVGLPSLPVTLENIKSERRWEFACEGIRYWDLMRWGDLEKAINENMKDIPITKLGKPATLTVRYRPETRGFQPIPESEILLSNGVLTQNPGWGSDSYYETP
jgi:hypothetical protein